MLQARDAAVLSIQPYPLPCISASPLQVCNDSSSRRHSRKTGELQCVVLVFARGMGSGGVAFTKRQGWIRFQRDQQPDLTQRVAQGVALPEGRRPEHLLGTTGRTSGRGSAKADLQPDTNTLHQKCRYSPFHWTPYDDLFIDKCWKLQT